MKLLCPVPKLGRAMVAVGLLHLLITLPTEAAPTNALLFAPPYVPAPKYQPDDGFAILAGTDGVLAGQIQVTGGATFPKVWFLQPDETPDFAPTFTASGGYEPPGNAFLAATRNGSRVLAGGQRQDQAFTLSQDADFFAPQTVRTLHPDWAVSSKVEGVFLDRNDAQFTELAFGSITAPNPEAALWRNGSFEYLPTPDFTAGSFVHGVSGYQSSLIRERFEDVLYSVPAHLAVGEYIGGGEPYTHACYWANFYLTPQTYRFTDIHPTNFLWSRALGVGDVWVAGSVFSGSAYQRVVGEGCPKNSSDAHALIWPTPEYEVPAPASARDVHPMGFRSSRAKATFNNRTVGHAETFDGHRHAMLWMQYMPVDLHACFPSAVDSDATTVMGDGRIAGWWRDRAGTVRPFLIRSPSVSDTAPEYGDTLLADANTLNPFFYSPVNFRYAVINDAGTTVFLAQSVDNASSVLFTRTPGGEAVPLVAGGQVFEGGIVTGIIQNGSELSLDEAGVVHVILTVTSATTNRSMVVRFRPDGSREVLLRTGDPLPEGRTFQNARSIRASADGRTAVRTGVPGNDYGFSIILHQGGTNTLVVRNDFRSNETNTPNNFFSLKLVGVTTNGEVFFTAGRYSVDPEAGYSSLESSLWRWRNGVRVEVLPLGSALSGGWRLMGLREAYSNAKGDTVLLASATNNVGLSTTGYWRLWSSTSTPELIALQDDLVPGGVLLYFGDIGTLNAGGDFLFSAYLDGNQRLFLARPGHSLEAFAPSQSDGGTRYINRAGMNRHREVIANLYKNFPPQGHLELFAPRPRIVNPRLEVGGPTFEIQAPVLNRPYTLVATDDLSGPWLPVPWKVTATNALTPYTEINPAQAHQFYRADRLP